MTGNHSQRAHAIRSASGSHRWLNCAGSVKATEGLPENTSRFAAEGTAAHELGEKVLSRDTDPHDHVGETIKVEGFEFEVTDEMAEAVQVYKDATEPYRGAGWEWEIERRFDLSELYPGMFGTCDFMAYNAETKTLVVFDFKYGRGVPGEPRDNSQGLYYALGAVKAHHNRGVGAVLIGIVQPRCPHPAGPVRIWETDVVQLYDFAADLVDGAKRTEDPNAPLTPGEWCKFCPAAASCPALHSRALEAAQADFSDSGELHLSDPATFDVKKLAETLQHVDLIEDWCRRVRDAAHHEAEAGRCPPGWKLVATRATRKWRDEDKIVGALRLTLEMEDEHIFADPKVRSPAQVEAVLKKHYGLKGKKAGEAVAPFVLKSSSGTVLVPESDAREPVRPEAVSEFEEVEG